jgi:hypothetical protein
MKKCNNCEAKIKLIASHRMVKGQKTLNLCKNCYDWYSAFLRKSNFSATEYEQARKDKEHYENELKKYLLNIKKYIKYFNFNYYEVIKGVIRMEEAKSVELYLKERSTLTIYEHLEIIKIIIKDNNFDDEGVLKVSIDSEDRSNGTGKLEQYYYKNGLNLYEY